MGIALQILSLLSLVTDALQGVLTGGAANSDKLAALLIKIAQSAATAYQMHTGQPIDPNALQPIAKVE